MKIIVAGGGTAGHVNAGITILDEFKKRYPGSEDLFIGTRRGIESTLIPQAGYSIKYINARGLKRETFFVLLYSLCLIPVSIIQSIMALLKFKPDAVIGVGGFASGPVLVAATLLRKPIFLLEQNTVIGLTNRIFVRMAKKIFASFPLDEKFARYKNKTIMSGNPVRSAIRASKRVSDPNGFNVFVFGGSQGSMAINKCVTAAIPLLNQIKGLAITHQAGKIDFNRTLNEYKKATFEHEVFDYIYDIQTVYDDTDLVISRAGASTIFELISVGIPSVLIPLPTAADNHQYFNAKFLSSKGCAEFIQQGDLTPELLVNRIKYYMNNRNSLEAIKQNIKKFAKAEKRPEQIIVEVVASYVG